MTRNDFKGLKAITVSVGSAHPRKMTNYRMAREGNPYFFTVVTYQQAADSWGRNCGT